jgi:hypothetical protein
MITQLKKKLVVYLVRRKEMLGTFAATVYVRTNSESGRDLVGVVVIAALVS